MNAKCKTTIELAIEGLKEVQQVLRSEAKARRERDPRAEIVEDAWIALENMLELGER